MWWQWWKYHAFRVRTTEYKCDASHQLENPIKVTCGVRVLQNSSLRGNQWGFSKHNPLYSMPQVWGVLTKWEWSISGAQPCWLLGQPNHWLFSALKFHRRGWPTQLELPLCLQTMVWILSRNWNNVARRLKNYILPCSLKGRSFPRPGR